MAHPRHPPIEVTPGFGVLIENGINKNVGLLIENEDKIELLGHWTKRNRHKILHPSDL